MGRHSRTRATLALVLGLLPGCAGNTGAPGSRPPEAALSYPGQPESLANCLRDRVRGQDECTEHYQKAAVAADPDGKGAVFTCTNYSDAKDMGMAVGSGLGPAGMLTGLLIGAVMDSASDPEGTKIYSARLRETAAGQTQAEFWVSRPRVGADKDLARMKSALNACVTIQQALPSATPAAISPAKPVAAATPAMSAAPAPTATPASGPGSPRPIVLRSYTAPVPAAATPPPVMPKPPTSPAGSGNSVPAPPVGIATQGEVHPAPAPEPGWR